MSDFSEHDDFFEPSTEQEETIHRLGEQAVNRNAEITSLRAQLATAKAALADADKFFAATLDPAEDQESWEWLLWLKIKQALSAMDTQEDG